MAILEIALFKNDTSVRFVLNNSYSISPDWVKAVSLWGALEGSILLWAWLQSMYVLVVALTGRNDSLRPRAMSVLFAINIFFLGVNATIGSPFIRVPLAPQDGLGPNPLLQNHWMMAVHPMLMYLGFVGLSVPFAYAMAAMMQQQLGETWLVQTRRYTNLAWMFLSAAIVAGAWWSYEVLGWGGYWAWDPVENASILPWFLITAFAHSLQTQERRRMLKAWNLGLIVAAFLSTLFGTFLTRSGIVQSVHAFGQGSIGIVFFIFLSSVLVFSLLIAYKNLPLIRDHHQLDSPISREGALLTGNLLFTSFAFSVALGTLFPVFIEAATGSKTNVGAPFFNQIGIPIGLAIMALQGIGPALSWRRVEGGQLLQLLRLPLVLSFITLVVCVVLQTRLTATITLALAMLNISVLVSLMIKATKIKMHSDNTHWFTALGELFNNLPRRYGAYVAHFGITIIAIGIAFSGGYRAEKELTLKPMQSISQFGHNIKFLGVVGAQDPRRNTVAAKIVVDGREMYPAIHAYNPDRPRQQSVASPAVVYGPWGDFYTVLVNAEPTTQEVVLKFISSPLISWIWWGGLLTVMGTAITLIPAFQTTRVNNKSAALPAASD